MLLAVFLGLQQASSIRADEVFQQQWAPASELQSTWLPPVPGAPQVPGGLSGASAPVSGLLSTGGPPNLHVLSASIADASGAPIASVPAGEPFWVRVDYRYDNPTCNSYSIRRTTNGWTNTAASIDWGCGYSGSTTWWHYWGAWYMHRGGTYSFTVVLDASNNVAESDETDNSMTVSFSVTGSIRREWALVDVDAGLTCLGDGTDVIVGTMDDALDYTHPLLSGNDSAGRPRLVAEAQNHLGITGVPLNSAHAISVMGIVLSKPLNGGDLQGLAPDARYVTAEFLNRAGIPGLPVLNVVDAAGFLVANGADVINMSWSFWFGTNDQSHLGETSVTNLMADYLTYGRKIVCVPAVNQLPDHAIPTAPGSSRNVITVGGMHNDLLRAWSEQDHGPTLDGRGKPDLLGNNAESAFALSQEYQVGFPAQEGFVGTSFSAPFVTGAVAEMLDYGKHTGRPTDPKLIKAILQSSCHTALDSNYGAWSHTTMQPLDDEQGTGIFDLSRVCAIYSAGLQQPNSSATPGFDLRRLDPTVGTPVPGGRQLLYRLGKFIAGDPTFVAALVWERHTFWNDANGNGVIDAADSFYTDPADSQDDLDLVLLEDGAVLSASRSLVDNVEHLRSTLTAGRSYDLVVMRHDLPNTGTGEEFALAWYGAGVFQHTDPWPSTTRVSVDSGGAQVYGSSQTPSISASGRYVAFASDATSLVPSDSNGYSDIFVRDRESGSTLRASVRSGGPECHGDSLTPSISADGRYVVFTSDAYDLVPFHPGYGWDVYVHDLQSNTTSMVSAPFIGPQSNGDSLEPSISADGRYVVFTSYASDIVAGDTNGMGDVFVRDLQTGVTVRASVASNGAQSSLGGDRPTISSDGRYVAFESRDSGFVAGDTNGVSDVFVHDMQTGLTTRASVDSGGVQGNDASGEPSIAPTGELVAFVSLATNLVPGDTNIKADVFLHYMPAGATLRVSVNSSGVQANGASIDPAISNDGRFVSFTSSASNMVASDTNNQDDVFLRDVLNGTTQRISMDSGGAQANNASSFSSISANGRYAAFGSAATVLVPGDTNGVVDVFVRDTGPSIVYFGAAPFCFGDGAGSPCPCGNIGSTGNGCANSIDSNGAVLTATGTASISADSLMLMGAQMPEAACLYFQGNATVNGVLGSSFGDGLRCVGGIIVRLGMKANVGGMSLFPAAGDLPISVKGAVIVPATFNYQCWYRNPAAFCTPSTFNLTNGVRVDWVL